MAAGAAIRSLNNPDLVGFAWISMDRPVFPFSLSTGSNIEWFDNSPALRFPFPRLDYLGFAWIYPDRGNDPRLPSDLLNSDSV